ncbi:hypothetical protein KC332_g4936 [Hortaea werneckii]|uniref:Major facilitator superfamily (MFS) profile domain-containing protein n=1 Tax=Hortaea werneckii TaxID=91943 RepID=A0A3M7JCP1_HORWE|nr:hypothetical protein KC358_g6038 [Hortaea werneckii]KAI6845750.1 hypothetical protein KC350_g4245 [Hortaea werneckii]KAI6938323.1 hypothetical protein KC341_g4966 [Hortaea werneckii]KAI6938866.1 hypothetical protein KC348_g5378 [Hortaea werneckii]KAI6973938.1 hypothetical protein KC321_g5381 [Hortaea werneckii]
MSRTAARKEHLAGAHSSKAGHITSEHACDCEPGEVNVGHVDAANGTTRVEAMRLVMGKHGLKIIWLGLILMLTVYQFDNALLYNYRNYAASQFNNVAGLSTLGVVGNIVFAVFKPPLAKLSNVLGRGETYVVCVVFYLLGYILCASSSSFGTYAGGFVFANIGQTGANIMNDIVISDVSSMRWRACAISASFIPFFITPWISGFIVEGVVSPNAMGWRWGIGMFAIIMPCAASVIIGSLLFYQRKAKKEGYVAVEKMTIHEFCSQLDLGGSFLLAAGFAMFLIPFSVASLTPGRWDTGWIIALIVVGFCILIGLLFYERFVAKHPVLPARYLQNVSIVLCCLLAFFDTLGFQATHTYFYTWTVMVQNMSARDATFLNYTNGVWQAVVGLLGGYIMYKTRRYKWLIFAGAVIKLIGYGIMLRVRGANNNWVELFVVQSVQGWGSGLVEIIVIVGAQVVVPHAEMPQVTALVLLFSFFGDAVGNAIAGGIYTGTFKEALQRRLGSLATDELVQTIFESITAGVPPEGSGQKRAIDLAYSDVLLNITYVAVATSVVVVALTVFLPNLRLPETVDPLQYEGSGEDDEEGKHEESETKPSADATVLATSASH